MKYIKNSEILFYIEKRYKSEEQRNIMVWRFINGLTYNEILKKIYFDFERLPDITKIRLEKNLRNKCKRFVMYLMREEVI